MHQKDFQHWGIEKEKINSQDYDTHFYPKVREIFYAKLGINIGFEADGKKEFIRPILILAKIGSLYWIVPMTSKLKNNFFHHEITSISFPEVEHSVIMLSQSRIIDKKRLMESLGMISKDEFTLIQKKMKSMYFPSF